MAMMTLLLGGYWQQQKAMDGFAQLAQGHAALTGQLLRAPSALGSVTCERLIFGV